MVKSALQFIIQRSGGGGVGKIYIIQRGGSVGKTLYREGGGVGKMYII